MMSGETTLCHSILFSLLHVVNERFLCFSTHKDIPKLDKYARLCRMYLCDIQMEIKVSLNSYNFHL